jgi:Ion channel
MTTGIARPPNWTWRCRKLGRGYPTRAAECDPKALATTVMVVAAYYLPPLAVGLSDSLYFTVTVSVTVGFGDITATS